MNLAQRTTCLCVLGLLTTVSGDLPTGIFQVIDLYFKELYGAHLYFCSLGGSRKEDSKWTSFDIMKFSRYPFDHAVSAFKLFTNESSKYNIRYMSDIREPEEILISYWQPQRLGVFLDVTCPQGIDFANATKQLYNATYSWILWSELGPENLAGLFEGSRLSADSEVHVLTPEMEVHEVYRVHVSAPLVSGLVGTFNQSGGPVQLSSPLDRRDFKGFTFIGSIMMVDIKFNLSNLLAPLLDKTYEPGKDMVRRYGLAVYMHLAEVYNFTYNFTLTNAWGDPLPNGTWTGMVGQVARKEADFGLAPAKYIVQRYDVIDFVTSLHIVKVCFTFLQPKLFGSAKALVLPLDDIVWFCLAAISAVSVVVFRIVGRYDHTGTSNDNWGGSMLLVFGAISQQGIPDNTEKASTRIVYVFLLIVTFFVAVYYNTAILNGLLLPAPNAIQNIEQLLKSDTKLGMLDIPYLHNELIQNDTLTVRVREKITKAKPKQIFYSVADGVQMIKKGRFALYTEDEAIYTEMLYHLTDAEVCSVSEVLKYNPFHVGAVAQKNSAYKELFNRAFSLMRERGILNRQLEHWLVKKPECHWRQDAISLGIEPLALAYALFIFGNAAAVILLGFEVLHSKKIKMSLKKHT